MQVASSFFVGLVLFVLNFLGVNAEGKIIIVVNIVII